MTDAPPVIEARNLTVALPAGADRNYAVEDVSFDITPGQTLCLVGESGSGKSITALSLLGMLPETMHLRTGTLHLQGEVLPAQRHPDFDRLRSAQVAMIFQDAVASLDPVQRVGTQLEEILIVHGVGGRTERRRRVMQLLRAVKLPDPERIYRAYPHQLSGGQSQRIVIAGALLLDPALLIADEPTTALDVTTQADILALIAELQSERGTAVLFITHDFGVVAEIADRIAVMKDGQIVEQGWRQQVLENPQHAYTQQLLAAAQQNARQADTGPVTTARPEQSILSADKVCVSYRLNAGWMRKRTLQAVQNVSLALIPGETIGIVGESGSGKSSLARALLRLEPIASGRIEFDGEDITRISGAALKTLRRKLQVVLQDPYSALDPRQSIGSAIAEGPMIHGASARDALAQAGRWLELVGLSPQTAERYPHEFSGGQRQRICIARALAVEPAVLIADEPVSSLDVSIQAQILELFADLQQRLEFALLFITHDLRVAAAICDRVIVMRAGQVVESGATEQVFNKPLAPYTRRLIDAAPGGLDYIQQNV